MRLSLILFLVFISVADCFCQNRNSVWCFGDSARIDFNTGATSLVSRVDSRGSCASIADTSGNLLFYSAYDRTVGIAGTYPVKVYDKLDSIMFNGDSIKGGGWYRELTITMNPTSSNLYYLFHIGVTQDYGFYYCTIDMSQNAGLGAVVQKNVQLQSFKCTDGLTAIKHGNGRDWWVFFRRWDTVNDEFYRYLITPSGIYNVMVQNIGSFTDNNNTKMQFSEDGSKMVMNNFRGLLEVYDFDRCSGLLSNPVTIHPEPTSLPYRFFFLPSAFSPNNRFLYVTATWDTCYLYQYDLFSPSPASTRITLDTITNDLIALGTVRLAPDGKIYLSHAWECQAFPYCYPYPDSVYNYVNMNLSVINYPDSFGAACGYVPYSFYLGGHRAYYGLPNNPDYDMPRLQGSLCDTIQWTGIQNIEQAKGLMYVTYISGWQKLFVNAQGLKGRSFKVSVYDMVGNVIYTEEGKLSSQYFTRDLNMAAFAKGMYIVNFVTDKERLVKKFIKD